MKTTKSKARKGTKSHEFSTVIVSVRDELRKSVLERVTPTCRRVARRMASPRYHRDISSRRKGVST